MQLLSNLKRGTSKERQLSKNISQQIFVGLQDMSWRILQHVFNVTIFCLEDILQDVLKTCLKNVLKASLVDVFKTSWRQTKYLLRIFVCNKSKCTQIYLNEKWFILAFIFTIKKHIYIKKNPSHLLNYWWRNQVIDLL